jgi:CDGSH-type Zn-finger protein
MVSTGKILLIGINNWRTNLKKLDHRMTNCDPGASNNKGFCDPEREIL